MNDLKKNLENLKLLLDYYLIVIFEKLTDFKRLNLNKTLVVIN